jgi:hypothetical protein
MLLPRQKTLLYFVNRTLYMLKETKAYSSVGTGATLDP